MTDLLKRRVATSYEEAFYNFIKDLDSISGHDSPVTKVALHPKVIDHLIYELIKKRNSSSSFNGYYANGELYLFGVQIVARLKDTF